MNGYKNSTKRETMLTASSKKTKVQPLCPTIGGSSPVGERLQLTPIRSLNVVSPSPTKKAQPFGLRLCITTNIRHQSSVIGHPSSNIPTPLSTAFSAIPLRREPQFRAVPAGRTQSSHTCRNPAFSAL